MSSERSSQTARPMRFWSPLVVLFIGLVVTVVSAVYVRRTTAAGERVGFCGAIDQTKENILNRLDRYITSLRGCAGLFVSSVEVTRDEFRRYLKWLDVQSRYPGIRGVGFAERVSDQQKDDLIAQLRQEIPGFRIWPEGSRPEYCCVKFLEPTDQGNLRMHGFDLFTDPVWRSAMELACESGRATASAMQGAEAEDDLPGFGFHIFAPVYRGGSVPQTVEQRRSELVGFVYSPFQVDLLLQGIFSASKHPVVDFIVYDGPSVDDKRQMYVSAPARPGYVPEHTAVERIEIAGRPWTISFASNPHFDIEAGRDLTLFALIGGLLVSVMLFFITRAQASARKAAEIAAEELRLSARALRASEAKFRRLVESNMIGVVFATTDGAMVSANRAFCDMIGRSEEEVNSGRVRWTEVLLPHSQQAARDAVDELLNDGVSAPRELECARPDGTRVSILMGAVMLEGSARDAVAFTVDLTERKRQERDLHAAKEAAEAANKAKDQFLAILSHELRTPLTPILAVATASLTDPDLPPRVRHDFEMIQRNTEVEARLIEDLLDVTRIGRGKLQLQLGTVDVHDALQSAVYVCSPEEVVMKRLALRVELSAEQHHVRGDHTRLQQVFWNLIKNAVKFTPADGTITVRTRNEAKANGGAASGQPLIVIEVQDTGAGIEPGELGRIFDAFEQGQAVAQSYGGLGLGLAISKSLVDAHGGTISASSAGRGKGATFAVTLRTVPAPQPLAKPAPLPRLPSPSLVVLLVEDHADTARAIKRLLDFCGYEVHIADSVAAAGELAARIDMDVLISDLGLPDGTGLDLPRRLEGLRAGRKRFWSIALTGYGMGEEIARSRAAGFNEHLTKPVDLQKLQEAIQRMGSASVDPRI